MDARANALKLPLLKAIFDLFHLDRDPVKGKALTRAQLVERLLDFLANPDEEDVKLPEKKGRGPAKKKKSDEEEEEAAADEEEEEEEDPEAEEENGIPSDAKLKKWVKAYINCFSLDKATTKHMIQTASDKFGVDVSAKKGMMIKLLKDATA